MERISFQSQPSLQSTVTGQGLVQNPNNPLVTEPFSTMFATGFTAQPGISICQRSTSLCTDPVSISETGFNKPVATVKPMSAVNISFTGNQIQQAVASNIRGGAGTSVASSFFMSTQQVDLPNMGLPPHYVEQSMCVPIENMNPMSKASAFQNTGKMFESGKAADAFDIAFTAPVTNSPVLTERSIVFSPNSYSEMVSDFGTSALNFSSPDQELSDLLDRFLAEEKAAVTSVCESTNSGNNQARPSIKADCALKAEPASEMLTQATGWVGIFNAPLSSVVPELYADQTLIKAEPGSSCSTPYTVSKAPATPDAISVGSATSYSEEDSGSESLRSDDDSSFVLSASVNNSYSNTGNVYQGQKLTDRQAIAQVRRLSLQCEDTPESVMPVLEKPSPIYAPPVSPVSSASDNEELLSFETKSLTGVLSRKRGKPKKVKFTNEVKRRYMQTSVDPGKRIIGFLLRELNKKKSKRVIHWANEDKGIYIKKQAGNDELSRRWGVQKNNPTMTYEKFHRALRVHYQKGDQPGVIKHLTQGPDGELKSNPKSPYYQIDLEHKKVKLLLERFSR